MKATAHVTGFKVWKGYGFSKLVDQSGAWLFFHDSIGGYQGGPFVRHFRTEDEMLKWLRLKLEPVARLHKCYDPRYLGFSEDLTPRWLWKASKGYFVKNPAYEEITIYEGGL